MNTKSSTGGFSLTEVLISVSLASVILASVLSSFLMMGRSGINIGHYNDMEAQGRMGLERFGQDVRQARAITWVSTNEITLGFPAATTTNQVTYKFEDGDFVRELLASDDTILETRALITGVSACSFTGYTIAGDPINVEADLGIASRDTKQLQLTLTATRTRSTVTTASNNVLSAQFILRNKPVAF